MSGTPALNSVGAVIAITDGATFTIDNALVPNVATLGQVTSQTPSAYFSITLGGNRTAAAFANFPVGAEFYLDIVQDGTGSRTITWNANVAWAAGSAPTLTTTAGATDMLQFTYNSRLAKWMGFVVGKAFA